jgi:hypothetical protein
VIFGSTQSQGTASSKRGARGSGALGGLSPSCNSIVGPRFLVAQVMVQHKGTCTSSGQLTVRLPQVPPGRLQCKHTKQSCYRGSVNHGCGDASGIKGPPCRVRVDLSPIARASRHSSAMRATSLCVGIRPLPLSTGNGQEDGHVTLGIDPRK